MEMISINTPGKIVVGKGSFEQFTEDISNSGCKRLFVVSVPFLKEKLDILADRLERENIHVDFNTEISKEPSFEDFNRILIQAQYFESDAVAGIGGGSIMDVAKVIAALIDRKEDISEVTGNGLIKGRNVPLYCLPTTAGTGSEVSPNAIFLDNSDGEKKGVISPFLMPDASYIDPELTIGVPPAITAYTGMDAFTHCLEAYTNKFSHPYIDLYALKGIEYIYASIKDAYDNGKNIEAREKLALGSLYGGMCLGPVNTASVHALAYPLGSKYKIAHGLSNAVLLPYVMEYNMPAVKSKYAKVSVAMGLKEEGSDEFKAGKAVEMIFKMLEKLNIPSKISLLNIPENELEDMARSALKVQRLLKNNPREMGYEDILSIYKKAY